MKFDVKFLKLIAFGILGVFIVISLITLLFPSTVVTNASVQIAAPKERIMAQLNDLENWKNWQPIFKQTSIPVTNKDAVTYTTNGKNYTIKIIERDTAMVRWTISNLRENDIENFYTLRQLPDNAQWDVEWRSITRLKWSPLQKFSGLFVSSLSKPGMEQALHDLKNYIEAGH